ncbi:MAG TPA: GGDEF domain-containing protein, partial [Treponemataceae bacterium]|nr:GGDEF domain-containing protein [Treponemataceae bacterium]
KGDPVAWIIMSERTTALEHIRSDLVFMYVSVLLSLILLISFLILIRRDRLRLKTLSLTDSLTGIANRVSLFDFLSREIHKSVRYDFDLSLILFDIDHFKQINDSYGHAEGDRVLVKTVEAVRSEIRSSDFLARLGGEEFVVILSHCPVEAAITAAEKIRRAVAQAKVCESSPVTISVGVASLQKEERADSLIARADQAMYRAKEAGRNCVRVSP